MGHVWHTLTDTLLGGSLPVSRFTLAAETSRNVQTDCILLTHQPVLTLVNICTHTSQSHTEHLMLEVNHLIVNLEPVTCSSITYLAVFVTLLQIWDSRIRWAWMTFQWHTAGALTLTDQQLVIINETHRTFTAETANHVDTHAVLTHTGNLTALVDVCGSQTDTQDGCEVLEEHADTEL